MARKEIIWSQRAKQELIQILDYYNTRNESVAYSIKLIDEIENLLNTLSQSEFIGRLTANKRTRVVVMKEYLIFYEINRERIEILSFWDNRQDNNKRIIK
jgi:toxin YoeB